MRFSSPKLLLSVAAVFVASALGLVVRGIELAVWAGFSAAMICAMAILWTMNERMRREQRVNAEKLADNVKELTEVVEELRREQANASSKSQERFEEIDKRVLDTSKRTRTLSQSHARLAYAQIEDLMALYRDIDPDQALPTMHGWAAGPDLARFLYLEILSHKRRHVLECGSGTSTVVMAYAMRAQGAGHVTAIEHNPAYAKATRRMLADRGLTEWAQVIDAPLTDVDVDGTNWRWYEPSALPAEQIDFLVVDGPPANTGPQARYPAVPLLVDRLTDEVVIVLDDARRTDERAIGDRWIAEFPGFDRELIPHDHGTILLRRNG